jgi:hypothetical protein
MYGVICYLILIAVQRWIRRKRAVKPRGLCAGCAFVHMQYGASGRNAVFCTFGAVVRSVQINVLYCTDYRDRSVPPRLVRIGFARENANTETVAEVATAER